MVFEKNTILRSEIEVLKQKIEMNPNDYVNWFNLALLYKSENDWLKAIKAYEKAFEINPNCAEAYFNAAYLFLNNNEPQKAIDCYKKVLASNPNDTDTKYFLALAQMQTKDYKEGLRNFEYRLCRKSAILTQEKTYPNLTKNSTIWQGEDITDKTIYVYYEAGFGDVIMFARYLPILQKRCKKIILKPQIQLSSWFKENYPDIEVMDYFKPESEINFDIHIPILSLPLVLELNDSDLFIDKANYLKPNRAKSLEFKEKYFNNGKFKIGIKWQGNTYYDTERIITIESFFRLMQIDNTQFYSCQTFEGSEELEKIPKKYEVIDLGKTFSDFSDTAAALDNMDLIICNDTSLAHVAGALGKPCWVLLPYAYNWRWHMDLSKCDWYDSVKLFRQKEANNWDEVFARVEEELIKVAN